MYPGFANGKSIYVLRDSGPNLIGIKMTLVKEEDYTGEDVMYRTFAGNREKQTC